MLANIQLRIFRLPAYNLKD